MTPVFRQVPSTVKALGEIVSCQICQKKGFSLNGETNIIWDRTPRWHGVHDFYAETGCYLRKTNHCLAGTEKEKIFWIFCPQCFENKIVPLMENNFCHPKKEGKVDKSWQHSKYEPSEQDILETY